MDYNMIKKKIIYTLFIIILFNQSLLANIVYEKDNILISEIEVEQFKELFLLSRNERLETNKVIKKIVLIKRIIKKIEKYQPKFIENLDNIIISEYGKDDYDNKVKRDFLRYIKLRNEFILEYFNRDLNINDIQNVINSFSKLELPISDNNCLTIIGIIDVRDNSDFINNLFKNFKTNKKDHKIKIDNKLYNICINENTYKLIEKKLITNIELKTEDNFNKFLYGN